MRRLLALGLFLAVSPWSQSLAEPVKKDALTSRAAVPAWCHRPTPGNAVIKQLATTFAAHLGRWTTRAGELPL